MRFLCNLVGILGVSNFHGFRNEPCIISFLLLSHMKKNGEKNMLIKGKHLTWANNGHGMALGNFKWVYISLKAESHQKGTFYA